MIVAVTAKTTNNFTVIGFSEKVQIVGGNPAGQEFLISEVDSVEEALKLMQMTYDGIDVMVPAIVTYEKIW